MSRPVTKKCCLGCPALSEYRNFYFTCSLGREIESRDGSLALAVPYSKEPCRKPKSIKECVRRELQLSQRRR